jgi:hypothetical protein
MFGAGGLVVAAYAFAVIDGVNAGRIVLLARIARLDLPIVLSRN